MRAWVDTLPADPPSEPPAFLLTHPEGPALPSGKAVVPAAAPNPPEMRSPELAQLQTLLQAEPSLSKRRLCEAVLGKPYAGSYAVRLDRLLTQLATAEGGTTTLVPENAQ